MSIALIARHAFPYAGRDLRAREHFYAESRRDADLLVHIGHAERYEARVMTRTPHVDISLMDVAELRAMAARLGVVVHHRSGAEKIRAAIRSAQG